MGTRSKLWVALVAPLLLTAGCINGGEQLSPDSTSDVPDAGEEPELPEANESTVEPSGSSSSEDDGSEPEEPNASTEGQPADEAPAFDDCLRTVNGIDLQGTTMADLQASMAEGDLTSVELVDAYVERFQAYDEDGPALNAIQTIAEDAREQAAQLDAERANGTLRGPLHGMPILLKDNTGTSDMPTTAGSIALAENVPPEDAGVTANLREAGAIIVGKTQLSEFANWMSLTMPNGYSSLGGQVINAYTLADPSGSSSGSGVAGSMAMTAGAMGTETSGSILSPSQANSLVGLKPTMGLASRAGIIPLAHNFDVPGPMTRNVHDAALMLGALAGSDPADPATEEADDHLPPGGDYTRFLREDALKGVRLGYDEADADDELFARALEDLERLGADLVAFDPGDERWVSLSEIGLIPNEFKYGLNRYLAEEAGPGLPVEDLTDIIVYNQQRPDRVTYGQDLLVASDATPGSREVADPAALGAITATELVVDRYFEEHDLDAIVGPDAPFTNQGAAAGYPTITVPMGYNGTEPHGLAFFGQAWSEDRLLAYGYAYEQATERREPPTVVNPALVDGVCNDEDPVEPDWP